MPCPSLFQKYSIDQRRFCDRGRCLGQHPQPTGHFGIGIGQVAQITAKHVFVQLLAGLDIPQAAAIGADLIGDDQTHEIALIDAAHLNLEVHQTDAHGQHHARQEIVYPQCKAQDVIHVLLAGPAKGRDMLFAHKRIAQFVVFVAIFDDGARQLRALIDAKARAQRTGGIVAHDNFKRHDFTGPHQLFTHVQAFDKVRWHPDLAQTRHKEFAEPVVQNTLALDHVFFLGVEGGGIILEILHDGAWLGAFIEDLCLAFVNLFASRHGRPFAASGMRVCPACRSHKQSGHMPQAKGLHQSAAPRIS
mmetsp:Transcript_18544/g.30523  ORF Transcript_18544/g.30523 Transcript_18544/m.30523 type:complete len:304 (-) Transcript_18544:324-1235(-)